MMMPVLEPCTLLAKCNIQKLNNDQGSVATEVRTDERIGADEANALNIPKNKNIIRTVKGTL